MRTRLLVALVVAILDLPAKAQTLRVVSEDWAPFTYVEAGKPVGLAVEMAEALLADAGLRAPVEILPWNRAYELALREANVLIFSMNRSPDREALFSWIFPIAPRETWLVKMADRADIAGSELEGFKAYLIGSGPASDASTQDLIKAGFSIGRNLDPSDADGANLQKLFARRVDLIVGNPVGLAFSARRAGLDYGRTAPVLMLDGGGPGYWAAMSAAS